MKTEYLIINGDDCIAIVYKHDTLGRAIVVRGNIDPNFSLQILDVNNKDVETIKVDMLEFLLQVLP